jgi:hypothetical protein
VRQTWQLFICHETRRAVGQLWIAFALLWPMLLLAVDHHGAERIPTHKHIDPLGEPAVEHAHGFTLGHVHQTAEPGVTVPPAAPSFTSRVTVRIAELAAPSLAILATWLLGTSSLPLLALMLVLAARPRELLPLHRQRLGQTIPAPPTPPPVGIVGR